MFFARLRVWVGGAVVVLLGAAALAQDPILLYSDEDYQLSANPATSRSQRFRATTSLPDNGLTSSDTFTKAAVKLIAWEDSTLTFNLRLYSWTGSWSGSVGGAPIAQANGLTLGGLPTRDEKWFELEFSPRGADGIYLIVVTSTAFTGSNWGILRSDTDDGGPDNDAYNTADVRNDREYQVRLDGIAGTGLPTPTPTPTLTHAPDNFIANPQFSTGNLEGWIPWKGNRSIDTTFRANALGCDNPPDGKAAGTDIGTGQRNFYTGLYQEIADVYPGVPFTLEVDVQMFSAYEQGGQWLPDMDANDTMSLAWVDGVGADWSLGLPAEAVMLATRTNPISPWQRLSAQIVPSGNAITIAHVAHFEDPEVRWSANSSLVDNWSLVPQGTPSPDIDGDYVPDDLEGWPPAAGQSHLLLDDSDGDGLSDGTEDANRNGSREAGETDTRNRDSDGDGLMDGIEVAITATNPLSAGSPASYTDADQDGLPLPHDPKDNDKDSDDDGYTDGYEAAVVDLAAVSSAAAFPPLGDLNLDGAASNLDALAVQSLFIGNITPDFPIFQGRGFRNADPSRDGFISNIDALVIQSFFIGNLPLLPL